MEACEVGKNRHACRLVSDSTKTKKITRPINETVRTSRLSCCERTGTAMDLGSAQRTQRNERAAHSTIPNDTNDKESLRRPEEYFEWLGEPFTVNGTRYQSAVSNGIIVDLFAPK